MGMERKKMMPQELMTPGRKDLSPWPPVAQLDFEKITAMKESELDRAFEERHGLTTIFKENRIRDRYKEVQRGGRRVEIKRIVLSLLEGRSLSGKEIANWYAGVDPSTENPIGSLQGTLFHKLSDECKHRIDEVSKRIAREALVAVPSPELQKTQSEINALLTRAGIGAMSVSDVFKHDNLPAHATGASKGNTFDVQKGLEFFRLRLEGLSTKESAMRLGIPYASLAVTVSNHLSNAAKDAIALVKYGPPLPKKQRSHLSSREAA